jgi:hypothetical protein
MQQGHRFVCSVATGVETGTPLRSAATGQGWRGIDSVPASQKRPPLPPAVPLYRWGTLQNFPHLFLGEVSLRGAVPLAGPPKRSVRLSCGVASTLAYPNVFESVLEASSEF